MDREMGALVKCEMDLRSLMEIIQFIGTFVPNEWALDLMKIALSFDLKYIILVYVLIRFDIIKKNPLRTGNRNCRSSFSKDWTRRTVISVKHS
jgi:hypothetical protein